ncbi:MAG: hypothetical protein RIS76_3983 [Verrucomicrobiota bacterium]|jgi:RNA polymerase sigma factor (sigma-70 family)
MNDAELLRAYLREGSQDAFAELVRHHVGLVYSAALRHLQEPSVAEEVTQKVFCVLAEKAGSIRDPRVLSTWLHRTSRQLSLHHLRTEQRRFRREQAAAMNLITHHHDGDERWKQLEPLLDEALESLGETDRAALLLRFFEARPMAEVGQALGVSEAAAKMRVGRALEKLRGRFVRQGIACTAPGLALLFERKALASPSAGLLTALLAVKRISSPVIVSAPGAILSTLRQTLGNLSLATSATLVVFGLVGLFLTVNWARHRTVAPSAPESPVAEQVSQASSVPEATGLASAEAGPGRLRLTVLDDETSASLPGVQIRARELASREFSADVVTDVHGECVVPKPTAEAPDFYFRLMVRHEGYVSTTVSWSRFQLDDVRDIPVERVIRLKRGLRIGGWVRGADGKAIPGATVTVQGREAFNRGTPQERGWLEEGGTETVVADAAGRWGISGLPANWSQSEFHVSGSGWVPADFGTEANDRGSQLVRVVTADLLAESAVFTLEKGRRLSGRVVDEQGLPVAGARIVQDRHWDDAHRRTESGADGTFEFANLSSGLAVLFTQASGHSPAMTPIDGLSTSPVVITLSPGGVVRGRVLAEDRQPVPLAEISQVVGPTHLVSFPIALKTDAQGRFVWDQAPPEGVAVSVFKAGFLPKEVSLAVGNTESEVVLKPWSSPARTRVRGSVVDEATGSPVDAFEVIISMEGATGSSRAIKAGADGVFVVSLPQPGGNLEVRSPGFAPTQRTVELRGEAEVTLEFRLAASDGWSGIVLRPDGQPAAGAEVALSTFGRRAILGNRRFAYPEQGNVTTANSEGAFHFEPEAPELESGRLLIAVHTEGYAEADADRWSEGGTLQLQPWGRIEGVLRNRSEYPEALKIRISRRGWNPWMQGIQGVEHFMGEPDSRGKFAFENLPPGFYTVGHFPGGGGSLSERATVRVLPGQTTRVEFGGEGIGIAGRLATTNLPPDFDYRHSFGTLERKQTRPVDLPRLRGSDFKDPAAYEQAQRMHTVKLVAHWQSAEGLAAWMEQRKYAVRFEPDGTWVADDIPPGQYTFRIIARTAPPPERGSMTILDSVGAIAVPSPSTGTAGHRVDLGSIPLVGSRGTP